MSTIQAYLGDASAHCGTAYVNERRGRVSSTFAYAVDYLREPGAHAIDPELPLVTGAQPVSAPLPRAFADAAPDRWGRRLIERRHASEDAEGRTSRALTDVDYLLGVSDVTRQGALRFATEAGGPFLSPGTTVPKLIALPTLVYAAAAVAADDGGTFSAVKTLLDAGTASLGGARPKAAVSDDGRLFLAKFPHPHDEWDVMAWEKTVLDLAADAGITVPRNRLVRIDGQSVLLVERFDREGDRRIGYLSAMTLLGANHGDTRDYLELAEAIPEVSADPQADVRELFRRIVFSVAVHNTDDHLRNHGFLRRGAGWRLSPVFDVNPNPSLRTPRITTIGGALDPADEIATLVTASGVFGLSAVAAVAVIEHVGRVVSDWQAVARRNGIPAAQIALFAPVFARGVRGTGLEA